jgi:hypothetical protein
MGADIYTETLEVLTPDSPRWETFVAQLDALLGARGCDAKSQRLATAIMRKMGGIDVEETLAYFEAHGGYCDCEILLNVEPW